MGTGLLMIDFGTILLVAAVVALAIAAISRTRRRRREADRQVRAYEADSQMVQAELSVLADDVMALEPQVDVHPEARVDYEAATSRYRVAQAAIQYADEPLDLIRVQRVVDEARYSMDRARALIAGREPPEPPEELSRPGRRGEPAIALDEQRQPVYVGYSGGFQGGWFGGGGGLFGGLLLGSLLGGFGGWGFGVTSVEGGDGGEGYTDPDAAGDWSGGDGGTDYGGGNDGGGDWGGGDFGGGDFGGGDF